MIFDATQCQLGEGPLWHPTRAQLFWFDITAGKLLSRDADGPRTWSFDTEVSAAGWVDHDTLLIASGSNMYVRGRAGALGSGHPDVWRRDLSGEVLLGVPGVAHDTDHSHARSSAASNLAQTLGRLAGSRRLGYRGVASALSVATCRGWLR